MSDRDEAEKSDREDQVKERSKDKDKSRRRRSSRSRSRSRRRDKKRPKEKETGKKGSRSRSKSGGRDKKRSRDRDRDRDRRSSRSKDRDRRRSRSKSPAVDPEAEEKKRAEQAMKAEREANRDDYTVFVSQIHPKVDEKDLFEFFSHVGRVEDIRLIRDQRTQKSKGLCYVEFWEKESVHKAVTLTGQLIGGYPITIVICQDKSKPAASAATPMRLYVGQLHLNVTDADLKPVFEAFGPLDFIDLHKDASGTSKGFGFVQFKNEADAKAALEALNGLEIAGKAIKVGVVDQNNAGDAGGDGWEADENVQLTAQSRADLMQKLGRGAAPVPAPSVPVAAAPSASLNIPMVQPTVCVIIKNMFDPTQEKDADFDLDIKEDVEEEANKFGPIKHIFVDKNSQGNVFIRFNSVEAAQKLKATFHGRWFASRQITAEFVIEQTYNAKFPDSAK